MNAFRPLEAIVGGVFIGGACGMYMLLAGRIAGNSGALKALILGPRELPKLAFVFGLIGGGVLMSTLLPGSFATTPPAPSVALALAGLAVGIGTALGNGCTSGHGLCGLSRLSMRSLVAVPTFMAAAIATATTKSGLAIGAPAPMTDTPAATITLATSLAGGLVVALFPCALPLSKKVHETYAGLWSGACFAIGLTVGGMVRPAVVVNALSPAAFDATLWVLFCTALAVTFAFYRVATALGVSDACATSGGTIDRKLVAGSILFGIGWGASGLCPGPHVVGLAANPTALGPLLMMVSVACGMRIATPFGRIVGLVSHDPTSEVATPREVQAALAANGATVVDLRPLDMPREATHDGRFEAVIGALSAPWDPTRQSMPTKMLPTDTSAPLVLHCRSGARAKLASRFLRSAGYTNITNAGGPMTPEQWDVLAAGRLHTHSLGAFAQLFDDGGSSTYTYILGDEASGEAIIIDPVLEHVERDLAHVAKRGLKLTLALNTHCHADHITGTGALKKRCPGVVSLISKASTAQADRVVVGGEVIRWGSGRELTVLATPGHTNGCVSFLDQGLGAVFTGDALFIGGCGRTDFQEGSAERLYESVTTQLFSLPGEMMVLPAHDYNGRLFSTVRAERETNPRFARGKEAMVELMNGLGLPYPKKLDVALPANMKCGLD